MVWASEYLEKNYPKNRVCLIDESEGWSNATNNQGKRRNEITELDLSWKDLKGNLDISDFTNLEELRCGVNQLNRIIFPINNKLKVLDCSNNHLISLDYASLNPAILKELNLFNNKLISADISVFSQLLNLTILQIGNNNEWAKAVESNKFYGSLKSLKELKKLNLLDISNTNINRGLEYLPSSLETFYYSSLTSVNFQVKVIEKEIIAWDSEWKTPSCWKRQGFAVSEAKEWIKAGAKRNDHDFSAWLRDTKELDQNWITNYQADYQLLSELFKQYGLCEECRQPNTGDQWCQACNKKNFTTRILSLKQSGNTQIDNFIQELQLAATEANKFLEWIPYKKLMVDPDPVGIGGFGKVYKAWWTEGNILYWDIKNKQWHREKKEDKNSKHSKNKKYQEVVLKVLFNSQNNTDFLEEAAKHKLIDDWFNSIVPCYGLSQAPDGNYLMVMQYLPEKDLRNYLKNVNPAPI